jgi:monofunctional biosynthetic peptidoglycan transglycosylase
MNIWTPPRSSFMLQDGEPIAYQYVKLDHISRYMVAATIAHEDQLLGTRSGPFDWEDFQARIDAYMRGEDDPSGSTIPQQLAKNVFLWKGQDPARKALEAGFAFEMSYSMSPRRMLELYLNYAEFGPKLYGICAASWYYFKTPPWAMTPEQAARLMGVVPFPSIVYRGPDGGAFIDKEKNPKSWDKLNGAANVWVPRQLEGMGGWQAAVLTIGIRDLASDHQAERDANPSDPTSCSTWPESVVDRYVQEGLWKD